MKVFGSVADVIGRTPVLRLNSLGRDSGCELLVKAEFLNPGGSVKDRIGYSMVLEADKSGRIKPGDTLIEPTSGNTGIGLAMVGACKGYRVKLTLPECVSVERRQTLLAFGALALAGLLLAAPETVLAGAGGTEL